MPNFDCQKYPASIFEHFKDGILGHGAIFWVAHLHHVPRTIHSNMWSRLEQAGTWTLEDALMAGDGQKIYKKAKKYNHDEIVKKMAHTKSLHHASICGLATGVDNPKTDIHRIIEKEDLIKTHNK